MKKQLFLTLLGSIFILSCATQQSVAKKDVVLDDKEVNILIPWKQSFFGNIEIKDSVLFYNSSEIRLDGEFFKQAVFIENGVVNVVDSINSISKVVPSLTAGGLMDIHKSSSGVIDKMKISFSNDDKISYNFIFYKTNEVKSILIKNKDILVGESFILNGKGELSYKGKQYPVVLKTNGDCILLFYYKKTTIRNEKKESAEGFK